MFYAICSEFGRQKHFAVANIGCEISREIICTVTWYMDYRLND